MTFLFSLLAIAVIIIVIFAIYKQIRENHDSNEPKIIELYTIFYDFFCPKKRNITSNPWPNAITKALTRRLDNHIKENVMDLISLIKGTSSYTENKWKILLCLKDKKNDEYYSNNMLVYVLAHEIAHVLCKSVGHTPEFHNIFNALLKELKQTPSPAGWKQEVFIRQ